MVRVRSTFSGTSGVIGHTGDDRVGGGSSPSESAARTVEYEVQWSVRYRNLLPFDSANMGDIPSTWLVHPGSSPGHTP